MAFLQRTMNRGSVSTGYEIENSLKLESDNSEYLDNRHHSAGNRRTWTLSFWIKRTELGTTQKPYDSGNVASIGFLSSDKIQIENTTLYLATDRVFRDTSAWYHIVLLNDSTQSTASNRAKLWINGVQETSFYSETYMPQNQDGNINSATSVSIGGGGGAHVNGYMAELFFVDGQALAPTDFGEFDEDSGIWIPKEYGGTLSGTSIKLDFSNSSALWEDSSGLSGNGTAMSGNNITAADQSTDTPTNNFCTLFPPPDAVTGTEPSVKEGGTTMFGGVSSTQNAFGTMGVRSGKWYFESTITDDGGVATNNHNFGVIDPEQITYVMTSGRDIGASPAGWACASNSLPRNNNASASGANGTGSLAENEIMGVAIDMDNGKIWWHRQGTWTSINSTVGNPANGTTPAFSNLLTATDNFVIPAGGFYVNDGNQTRVMNFGGYAQAVFTAVGTYTDANGYGSFAYQPPSGYYALCGKNLAEFGGTA